MQSAESIFVPYQSIAQNEEKEEAEKNKEE